MNRIAAKFVGAHVSIAGGVENAPLNAVAIGARAFAMFTKNQRQWKSKPLTPESVAAFRANLEKAGIAPRHVLPHDGYLINVGHPDAEKREVSVQALLDEARRAETLGLVYLNFHPGSHLGQSSETECLGHIADAVNRIIAEVPRVVPVIEATAGQGSNVGHRFEHLAAIIERVKEQSRVGVCLDTCHIFAAGYDIRTPEAYERTMAEFERVVGFGFLRGLHLNDAMFALGSRKDRHHSIGKGVLGETAFSLLMNDPRLDDLPLVLETIDESLWAQEIRYLCGLVC